MWHPNHQCAVPLALLMTVITIKTESRHHLEGPITNTILRR
jgi:hypothetical protein